MSFRFNLMFYRVFIPGPTQYISYAHATT